MFRKSFNSFRLFTSSPLGNIFVVTVVIVLVSLGASYLLIDAQSKEVLIEQMLHREQMSVRAGARSIEIFFDLYERAFVTLSTEDSIRSLDQATGTRLEEFTLKWEGTPVAGIVLIDKNGIVKFNGNRNKTPELGGYLGDRDYFTWAKTAKDGEVNISNPAISRLGASKGKYIVNVSTPILDEAGNFNGLLSSSIILEELTDHYISPLKITEKSYEYFLNSHGDVLGTDHKGVIGVNFFKELERIPFLGSTVLSGELKKHLESETEGKLEVAYPTDLETMIPQKMLVSYSPLRIGEAKLVLAIATPEKEALLFLVPIHLRSLAIIAGAFVIIVVVGIRFAKIRAYKEAVTDEHQLHDIK